MAKGGGGRQKFITCGKNQAKCTDPHCMRPKDRNGMHLRISTHTYKERKRRGNR